MKRAAFLVLSCLLISCTDGPDPADPRSPEGGSPDEMDGGAPPATDGGRSSTGSTGLPCDVEAALDSVCRDCHQDPPLLGAPMPLLTWEDTHQPAVTDDSKTVYELMGERINDPDDPMPPQGFELAAEHEAVLEAWIADGAPERAAGETCETTSPDAGMGEDGGVLGGVGPDALPCTPDYEFRAHDETDPTQGYPVPPGSGDGNYYMCFAFQAPFADGEQGTAWAPVIDDARVLHHWILWESPNAGDYTDGDVFPCGALPDSDSKFLMGWAPGGENFVMPDDVGLQLDPGSVLLLQIHYWNAAGHENVRDESGVALCTDSGRSEEAGVIAVGPTNLTLDARDVTTESVSCPGGATQFTGGFDILSSFPHMHRLGQSFTTEILRSDGTVDELVHVEPWSFDDQVSYPQEPPVPVASGDGIRVSCTFDNDTNQTVYWGENSEEEMCFDFLLVSPVPDLSSLGYDGTLICNEDVASFICSYYPDSAGCP